MNLYEIVFTHYSQKDNQSGIKEYCISNSDEDIFAHINTKYAYDSWTDREDEYEGEYSTYKEFVLENKGDNNDENLFEDLYYGQTTYGWKTLKENLTTEQINNLMETGIVKMILTIKGEI